MPKPVSRRRLIQKLRKLGFFGPFVGGRHQFMERGNLKIIIPNPHNKDIGSSLVSKIIRDINAVPEEFDDL